MLTRFAEYTRSEVLHALKTQEAKPNGYGRRFISHSQVGVDIIDEVFSLFGINSIKPEPLFGTFIGNHFLDGAAVQPHNDPAPIGFHHVRCNIAIEMPVSGGNPVNNGVEKSVDRGDIWICFASIDKHWSTPIMGGQRIILSLGALVEKTLAERVYHELHRIN